MAYSSNALCACAAKTLVAFREKLTEPEGLVQQLRDSWQPGTHPCLPPLWMSVHCLETAALGSARVELNMAHKHMTASAASVLGLLQSPDIDKLVLSFNNFEGAVLSCPPACANCICMHALHAYTASAAAALLSLTCTYRTTANYDTRTGTVDVQGTIDRTKFGLLHITFRVSIEANSLLEVVDWRP